MSEQQRETAFLRHCLSYAESSRRQELDAQIVQIQRDERCVQRAVWVVEVMVALIAAGLGYAVVLADNFPYDQPQIIIGTLSALGLAAIICLLVFVQLKMGYRQKLEQRRDECRQLIMKLLASRLGPPVATPLPETTLQAREDRHPEQLAPVGRVTPHRQN